MLEEHVDSDRDGGSDGDRDDEDGEGDKATLVPSLVPHKQTPHYNVTLRKENLPLASAPLCLPRINGRMDQ